MSEGAEARVRGRTHDVFISHSSKNKTVADTVCAILERRGIRCWIAPRDITPGQEWAQAIIRGIAECRAFILIFSTDSNASAQVRREVERAANHEIPIIPFRLDNVVAHESLEFFISSPHWLDALSPPLEQHVERLADVVRNFLNTGQAAPPDDEPVRAKAPELPPEPKREPARAAPPLPPPPSPPPPPPPPPQVVTVTPIRSQPARRASPWPTSPPPATQATVAQQATARANAHGPVTVQQLTPQKSLFRRVILPILLVVGGLWLFMGIIAFMIAMGQVSSGGGY